MSSELLAMHQAFLTEISGRREALEKELQQLAAVEDYHRKAIASLPASNGAKSSKKTREITDLRLLHASRHDACCIALKELGGQAKTQQVADWLLERGYGAEIKDPRVFHNTCYLAMKRRGNIFTKVGPGEWALAG